MNTAAGAPVAFPPLNNYCHWCPKMEIGQTCTSFPEFEKCLKDFKEQNNHPLRVFNSQTAKNYDSKYPADYMDEERFSYNYYNVRCIHYGESRHHWKGVRFHQQSFN